MKVWSVIFNTSLLQAVNETGLKEPFDSSSQTSTSLLDESPQKTVYVHIGMPKTGTSSVQTFCVKNPELFETQDLLYPKTGQYRAAHHLLAWSLRQRCHTRDPGAFRAFKEANLHTYSPNCPQVWSLLRKEIDQTQLSKVLLSAEELCDLNSPQIRYLKKELTPHLIAPIIVLRNSADFCEANYKQTIRGSQATWSIEAFYHKFPNRYDRYNVCKEWNQIADQPLQIISYDRQASEKILGLLGLQIDPIPRANVSCPSFAVFLTRFIRLQKFPEEKIKESFYLKIDTKVSW